MNVVLCPSANVNGSDGPFDSKAATRRDSMGDRKGCSAGIPECKTLIAAGAHRHVPETEVRLTCG